MISLSSALYRLRTLTHTHTPILCQSISSFRERERGAGNRERKRDKIKTVKDREMKKRYEREFSLPTVLRKGEKEEDMVWGGD